MYIFTKLAEFSEVHHLNMLPLQLINNQLHFTKLVWPLLSRFNPDEYTET